MSMKEIKHYAKDNGLKIVDATDRLDFGVLSADARTAKRLKASCCAVAEACKRQMPVAAVWVHPSVAYVRLKGERVIKRYIVPNRLKHEIVDFDRYGAMAPGEYYLLPPSKRLTLKARRHYEDKRPARHATKGTGTTPTPIKRVPMLGVRRIAESAS